jgi:hypothetical protein
MKGAHTPQKNVLNVGHRLSTLVIDTSCITAQDNHNCNKCWLTDAKEHHQHPAAVTRHPSHQVHVS